MPVFHELDLPGAWTLDMEPIRDDRGWFARYFCAREGNEHGLAMPFVQFNHSFTRMAGTIRGMHLQVGEDAEAKLVKCVHGRVCDVLLDLRRGSSGFMRHVAIELSADNGRAVYIPLGVAHGFQTLEDDTQLIYHHSNFYAPGAERGVRHDDPRAAIAWPRPATEISEKDRAWPLLDADFDGYESP